MVRKKLSFITFESSKIYSKLSLELSMRGIDESEENGLSFGAMEPQL